MLSLQSSTLWSSLILVVISLLLVIVFLGNTNSLIIFLFVIIFIGGLILLLVIVASISSQDQRVNINYLIFSPLLGLLLLYETKTDYTVIFSRRISWLDSIVTRNIILALLLLIVGLVVMSNLLLTFKGLARGM